MLNSEQIGKILGCSATSVQKFAKRHGYQNGYHASRRRELEPKDVPIFEAHQRGELPIVKACKLLRCSTRTFYRIRDEHGYPCTFAPRDGHYLDIEAMEDALAGIRSGAVDELATIRKIRALTEKAFRKYRYQPDPSYKPTEQVQKVLDRYDRCEFTTATEVTQALSISKAEASVILHKTGRIIGLCKNSSIGARRRAYAKNPQGQAIAERIKSFSKDQANG